MSTKMGGWTRRRLLPAALGLGLLASALAPALPGLVPAVSAAEYGTVTEDGVLLRESPGFDGAILGTLASGAGVDLRVDVLDTVLDADGSTRWWPVASDLGEGWVAGAYLAIDGWSNASVSAPAADSGALESWQATDSVDGSYDGGETALVAEDGGNFRSQPGLDGETIRTLGAGTMVDVRLSDSDTVWADGHRWWPVSFDGVDGWMAGEALEASGTASAQTAGTEPAQGAVVSEAPATSAAAPASGRLQGWAKVLTDDGSGLNIRADAAPDAERVGGADEFDLVEVMDGPTTDPLGNPWYMIRSGNVTGWVFGDYLDPADEPTEPVTGPGVASGSFMYPVRNFQFTQGYGCSQYWWHYAYNAAWGCHMHNGIDLAAPYGTAILAADGGEVEQAGWCDCGLGWYVKIDHLNGFKTVYGHLSAYYVVPGELVEKGDTIAAMGSTGNSTGSHLHFSTEYMGVDYNPFNYLP